MAGTSFSDISIVNYSPICAAYFGGASLARDGGIGKLGITRGEYLESGSNAWRRRNDGGTDNDIDGAVKEVVPRKGRARGTKTHVDGEPGVERKPSRTFRRQVR